MAVTEAEIQRFAVVSVKPFEAVVATLRGAVGRPDMAEFARAMGRARTFAEFEEVVRNAVGTTGLMVFMELDLGAVLRLESGLNTPRIIRFIIGNPLIMKEMVKRVSDAGSYAPVTILVDERPDGVHLSYDRMTSLLAPYENPDALAVAQDLDSKIEILLRQCAK
jgi:uncharacterized protein (DUF302 family)